MLYAYTMFIFFCSILHLGASQLDIEIADTQSRRNQGLMYRKELAENKGMLFVYEEPDIVYFWMKNTYIPLTIGFFDEEKVLTQIEDMEPTNSPTPPIYKSKKMTKYALEVTRNWFKKNKISIGDKFTLSLE